MDSAEFKTKVIPLGRKLYNFARLLLDDQAEAQDAVQEVYIKLWNNRNKMRTIDNTEAFAMKITRNWCLDRLKAKKPVLIEDYSSSYDFQKDKNNPHTILENTDRLNEFNNIMQSLPEQQKVIIQLRDVDGYEFEEIADILNINLNTVRVNLSRARKKIKESIIKSESHGY
jgi:RNA polymerase sigma-70 factor (ECF subfamily)